MKKTAVLLSALTILFSCKKDNVNQTAKQFTDSLATTVNKSPNQGIILFSPYINATSGQIVITDYQGHLVAKKSTSGPAYNFQRWNINGNIRYTYLVDDLNGYHIPGYSSTMPGYVIETDENLNEINRFYLLSSGTVDARTNNMLDCHDFILLSDNHYIGLAFREKIVTNIPGENGDSDKVIAPIIQEVNNGQVVWQWDATDHPELYANSVESNDFNQSTDQDYLHLNSMYLDPKDNNLICSFRNANQIIKISRQSGSILWKLGGNNSDFPITNDQQFLRQHCVTLHNDTLLIFDNGLYGVRNSTRIVEMKINEAAKTINYFSAVPVPGLFCQYMGSVQKINGLYFVGGGTVNTILEFNPQTGEKTFEMPISGNSYRARKY
ncbi:MAG: aryl-sulfate sulfotransferase [Bacteroidetes bacterium]|nr:aryl-sulfate sulfotransferase [Bacteroidota bacterium]MBS1740084.1 aryl-sulfate sulfotransferase [Bacteroidota bacterium]